MCVNFLRDSMIQSGCTSSITNPIKCSHSARCFWTYGMAWGCTSSFSIKHSTSSFGPFRARNAQIYQGECSRTTSGEFSLENGCSPFSIVVNLWLFNLFVGSPLQQPHDQQWYTACTRPLICPFTASNVPGLRKEREAHRCAIPCLLLQFQKNLMQLTNYPQPVNFQKLCIAREIPKTV